MRSWLKDAVEQRVQSVEDRVQYFRENFTHTKDRSQSRPSTGRSRGMSAGCAPDCCS
ncbi:unnamed protein product [Effrenium voratum]|uniref:Uncharacterized protein n=1 Tax=Effrenium voratum TaxID=2562239 RepID=A0AA36IFT1_9DINO|nr:unnamed protein product [Effrenium voratum]CAJ1426629.1 unnamed protein product [Effrenium voratum]